MSLIKRYELIFLLIVQIKAYTLYLYNIDFYSKSAGVFKLLNEDLIK